MARSFVQLSFDERRIIARVHEKKVSQAEIARALQRDRSTICREIRRNFWHDDDVPIAEGYWHMTAHGMAMDGADIASCCVIRTCALRLSIA
jgi:IS30 family transposase